jgi:ribosome-associated toxin RatA of RatAB toxin-antitoxin module
MNEMEAVVASPNSGVTLINTFTVDSGSQRKLMDLLVSASEQTMRHLPGFRSARVYQGVDGTSVANCVEWRSREDITYMLQQAGAQQHIAEIRKITKGNPQVFELYREVKGLPEAEKQEDRAILSAEHEIVISRKWEECFDLCRSLDRWHEFMPAVRNARAVWERNGDQEIEITAHFNDQVLTWRSRREIIPDQKMIRFWSLTPRHPIKALGGTWFFEPTGSGETRVNVSHNFELADAGQEPTVRAGISRNMIGDLKGMKEYLEKTL